MAAASSGLALAWATSMRGRAGLCFPLRVMAAGYRRRAMTEIPVFNHDAVLAAVAPRGGDRARAPRLRGATSGEWAMPAKVYLDSPPHGDFRAMPAQGAGLAILKWVTSFPGNPAAGCRW